jgi:hypothetical protein
MKLLDKNELKALSQVERYPAISLFSPMHEAGKDTRENPIRFKNRLREAEQALQAHGLKADEIEGLLAPAQKLVDDYRFWQHQRKGLAMFLAPDFARHYRLPIEVSELTLVGERFHLKPLLPLLSGDGHFYVLVVSLNEIRLLEGTRFSVSEVPLEAMPRSLAESMRFDVWQKHFEARKVAPGGGEHIVTHGHGPGDEDEKVRILEFFHQVDSGVRELLAAETAPLVFVGVEYLFGLYKEANRYRYLLPEAVEGNYAREHDEEIHARAWAIAEPHFKKAQAAAKERFAQRHGDGQASSDVREVIQAAADARIETLFVALDAHQWGYYDSQTRTATLLDEQEGEDLLDFAAVQTLLHGGEVYAVPREEVPGGGKLAAIYRF